MFRSKRMLPPVAAFLSGLCSIPGIAQAQTPPAAPTTTTPIQHVVVIYQENVSFDHYFGTYPVAANTDGNKFVATPNTPSINGLSQAVLKHTPNLANPTLMSSSQAMTCDQGHSYSAEQKAADG